MNKREELDTMLEAVDQLAKRMKAKLRKKAREGRQGGLHPDNLGMVETLLQEHVDRLVCAYDSDASEPEQAVDVCNLAMMLWVQGGKP